MSIRMVPEDLKLW